MKHKRSRVRKNIAWSLRNVHKMKYSEVAESLGISAARAHHLVKQCEIEDLQRKTQDACVLFRTNDQIACLGKKFIDEALALCESLNGVVNEK